MLKKCRGKHHELPVLVHHGGLKDSWYWKKIVPLLESIALKQDYLHGYQLFIVLIKTRWTNFAFTISNYVRMIITQEKVYRI